MNRILLGVLCLFLAVSSYCQEKADTASIQFTRVGDVYDGGVSWAVCPDSLFVLVDSSGTVLTKMKYQVVRPFYNGVSIVKRNSSVGFVNLKGVEVGRCIYSASPDKFGTSQFVYRPGSEIIGFLYHFQLGYVWLNDKGKTVVFAGKRDSYSISDKIPDALWDY